MAKGAYIGVSYTPLSPTFSDNSWEQIVYACRNNCVPDTWAVGNQKSMKIGDADYLIDIIGKHHDTFSDGSGTAPLTLMLHDVYTTQYPMNSSDHANGGWDGCEMRTTHLPAILKLMPSEVQSGIKEVNKVATSGGTTLKTSADKLFLLSEVEVRGYESSSYSGQGSQYAYYANGNAVDKYLNGNRVSWWLRSPYNGASTKFCAGWTANSMGAYPANDTNPKVAFAFCFGGTTCPSSIARKIKKGYLGIDNIARKIKKAYIGIGGVARPCWSGGELAYYGQITPLSEARMQLAATSIVNYTIFAGGYTSRATSTVDAYDTSLTKAQVTQWVTARNNLAAASVSSYALFGGGANGTSEYYQVERYDNFLTFGNADHLITARTYLAATSTGIFAWFAGGTTTGGNTGATEAVDAYNDSLTHTSITSTMALSVARHSLAATSIADYALFGGGRGKSANVANVDAFNKSLTRTALTNLTYARQGHKATTVGGYAIFGGGDSYSTCDVYDSSLTKTNSVSLSEARVDYAAVSVGNYAIFAGGTSMIYCDNVDVFDASLTRTTGTPLSVGRGLLAGTTIGNYAIFGGGRDNNGALNPVDAYVVS